MSQIKLLHSGGNGVILAAPSSNPAADRTLTLPGDADGTIATTANAGKILQVLSSSKSDAQTINVNSTAAQDIIGTDQNGSGSVFCVKITPSSAINKILFTACLTLGMGGGASYVQAFMKRDSTTLLPSTHGTGNSVNATFGRSGSYSVGVGKTGDYTFFPPGDNPSGGFNSTGSFKSFYEATQHYENFVTHSEFRPYITTIGLYNDAGELLVVGRTSRP